MPAFGDLIDAFMAKFGTTPPVVTVANTAGSAVPASLADGADATQGLIADTKVTGDAAGTISAKLRGLNASIGEIQASPTANTVLARLKTIATDLEAIIALLPAALGQGTMAQGFKVVLATDQTAIPINLQPTTSGGSSVYGNLDLGATGVTIKASAGQVYNYYIANQNATLWRYVKLYNQATDPASTDTPVITLAIPPGSAANVAFPNGIAFGAGIGIRATTTIAVNGNVSPSTNDVVVFIGFK